MQLIFVAMNRDYRIKFWQLYVRRWIRAADAIPADKEGNHSRNRQQTASTGTRDRPASWELALRTNSLSTQLLSRNYNPHGRKASHSQDTPTRPRAAHTLNYVCVTNHVWCIFAFPVGMQAGIITFEYVLIVCEFSRTVALITHTRRLVLCSDIIYYLPTGFVP